MRHTETEPPDRAKADAIEQAEWQFDMVARQNAQEALIEVLLLILLKGVAPAMRRDFLNALFARRAEVSQRIAGGDGLNQFIADLATVTDMHIKRIIDSAGALLADSSVGVAKN